MIRWTILIMALALLGAPILHAQVKPDLTGEWTLDKTKSTFSNPQHVNRIEKCVMRITNQEQAWQFLRVFNSGGTDDTLTYTLTPDGKDVEGSEDGMQTVSQSYWQDAELVYITRYITARGDAVNTVHYALKDNGHILQAIETFRGPRLKYDNIWIFVKK